MIKVTAQAPANIAFIKYWGKKDEALRLPLNSSISMNLSGAYTMTTVEFSPSLVKDSVTLVDGVFSEQEETRVIESLNRIRAKAHVNNYAKVVTKNTFPKGAGMAASASGFAALTVAGFTSLGVNMPEREVTIFARMGSGSACRSIPDGFVMWEKGRVSDDSYAYSLHPHTYWDVRDVLVIVDSHMKKVSTTEGMEHVSTSPLLSVRLASLPKRISKTRDALQRKDFPLLGRLIEEDCLDMHRVMQSQDPPLLYWNDETVRLMDAVGTWRRSGLPVYFTIDAGPNVHLICEGKDEKRVCDAVKGLSGVQSVLTNTVAEGARIVNTHLF